MKRLSAIALLGALVACSPPATEPVPTNPTPEPALVQAVETEAKWHYGPGTDPQWAQASYATCEEQTDTVPAYNRCLEEMAEHD